MSDKISPFAKDLPEMPEVKGVRLATSHSGMRYKNRDDLLLVVLDEGTVVAGVFTKNQICGAPITLCRENLVCGKARALIVNAGYANVLTGGKGLIAAEETAKAVAKEIGTNEEQIFVASTGVIGEQLPYEKIVDKIPQMVKELSATAWHRAALSIKTTDTFAKAITRRADIGGKQVTINGIIKGSGMIAPNMATMLGYVFTDAKIPQEYLQKLLDDATKKTYNCITVDSDTSTSDMILCFSTGKVEHWEIDGFDSILFNDFKEKFMEVHHELAQLVIRDGEGVSKLVTIHVNGAENDESARVVGLSIANSPLMKCAITGGDPNWGRIGMAIGKTSEKVDMDALSIWIDDQKVAEDGSKLESYVEADAANHMKGKEVTFTVNLGVGEGSATVWGNDLTDEYLKINIDYRS